MTHKLFHDDVYMQAFDAEALECVPDDSTWLVRLNQTAFYATSGGQPSDSGTLNGAQVLDVIEDDSTGELWHRVASPISGSVHGTIDWPRRFDNMQQHGGQHLLSWAIRKQLGGYTYGLHIGADVNTIDTDLPGPISRETLDGLERAVNAVIWQDLPIRQWFPDDAELARLPLRKKPSVSENIRIVATGDIEYVACCGTHPGSTGQIGLITLLSAHPARAKTRFFFLCGRRAFEQQKANALRAEQASALLSSGVATLPENMRRLLEHTHELERELKRLRTDALTHMGEALISAAPHMGNVAVIAHRFDSADRDSLRECASTLAAQPGRIALLTAGSDAGDIAVFARSKDVAAPALGELLGRFVKAHGGKGGGRPDFAQGGAPSALEPTELLAQLSTLAEQE